ncbi:hypothetical protein D3C72_1328270 [compost metagenome]
MSGAPSAPTINWVDWPAGAKAGGRTRSLFSGLAASSLSLTCPMVLRIRRASFSGARRPRASSRGSSILADRRSA